MVKIQLEPLRGMRDVVPPESELMQFIVNTFSEVAESYGYRRVVTPTIERFELFALKSGEEIRRTMYVFTDKGGREVALRPEFTPSVVRLYLRLLQAEAKPIRVYYVGPVFRYDEPQRGRYREFNQAGVEVLGADSIYHDVELMLLLRDFYKRIGLSKYEFKINNIGLVKVLAKSAGLAPQEEEALLHLLDKGLVDEAKSLLAKRNPRVVSILDILARYRKVDPRQLDEVYSIVREELGEELAKELDKLISIRDMLLSLGIDNFYVDLTFARGIAYYTGTIFEVEVPSLGLSIAGGGRYDDLTCVYGGPSLKMTGFAIGVERTMMALQTQNVPIARERPRALVVSIEGLEELRRAIEVAESLRSKGVVVQVEHIESPRRLSRIFEYASKKGFGFVVVVGRKEVERGEVVVKDLSSWKQVSTTLERVIEVVMRGAR